MIKRQPCELWSRVVGFFRPTCQWNKGKRSEFADRKTFNEWKQAIEEKRK
jgi:anaerobic ribonucleoside-triphosphate reductase